MASNIIQPRRIKERATRTRNWRCWGISDARRLEADCSINVAASQAYTKKRGAGVKPYVLKSGESVESTPFEALLTRLFKFDPSDMTPTRSSSAPERKINDSKPDSPNCIPISELDGVCSAVIRLLNDRQAILWRGSPEDDALASFQNSVLLIHELYRASQAFTAVRCRLKEYLHSISSASRIKLSRVTVCPVRQIHLLQSKLRCQSERILSLLQTRSTHFILSLVCLLTDQASRRLIGPGAFRHCKTNAPTLSATGWSRLICPRRNKAAINLSDKVIDDDDDNDTTRNANANKHKAAVVATAASSASPSSSQSILAGFRMQALVPLLQATKTHCPHPSSIQILSQCINVVLDQFLLQVYKEASLSGLDQSGVVSMFEQIQELRAWVISAREEMGWPVLLQDINSWLRADEIFWTFHNSGKQQRNEASSVGGNSFTSKVGIADNSALRRYDNGAIESGNSFSRKPLAGAVARIEQKRKGLLTFISTCGGCYDPEAYKASVVVPASLVPTDLSARGSSRIPPGPPSTQQIDDFLQGRVLLSDSGGSPLGSLDSPLGHPQAAAQTSTEETAARFVSLRPSPLQVWDSRLWDGVTSQRKYNKHDKNSSLSGDERLRWLMLAPKKESAAFSYMLLLNPRSSSKNSEDPAKRLLKIETSDM